MTYISKVLWHNHFTTLRFLGDKLTLNKDDVSMYMKLNTKLYDTTNMFFSFPIIFYQFLDCEVLLAPYHGVYIFQIVRTDKWKRSMTYQVLLSKIVWCHLVVIWLFYFRLVTVSLIYIYIYAKPLLSLT